MNRTTALLVAAAILLGHALAIHKTAGGEIAPPYDVAYVAFRIARNFVQTGHFAWETGVASGDSYPSLVWIGVAAIAERLYLHVNQICQALSMLAAFACVFTLAQFSPVRLSGAIAPLLFVVSGGIASAALSGTETSTLAFLVLFAFLAYERGWRWCLGVSLALTVVARPQGLLFALCLLSIEVARRVFAKKDAAPRKTLWLAFGAPLALALIVGVLRHQATGHFDDPWLAQLLELKPRVAREGAWYLLDFVVASGNALLFVFPLWYLARGVLSGVGARACVLTLAWATAIGLAGGGHLPFFEALTPIVAVMLVAVQEAMQIALDSKRRAWPKVTWTLFVLGQCGSALASKLPGHLGPVPFESVQRAWMTPRTVARFGYEEPLGRMGLAEEILATERLREIGIFLRDHLDPSSTVLSPWPGAIGYLSRLTVIDPLGRTTPSPGADRTRAWEGLPRADVAGALAQRPDYIVPTIRFGPEAPTAYSIAAAWAKSLDNEPNAKQRSTGIHSQLIGYELITLPVTNPFRRPGTFPRSQFQMMRRRDLGLSPKLLVIKIIGP